jgi:hypothetical protein
MAHWRIELGTEDVVELSRGLEVVVSAVDEDQDDAETTAMEVVITLRDV